MVGGFILACITDVNCQYLFVFPRSNMQTKATSRNGNILNIMNIQMDPYNKFPSRNNLKSLKRGLEQIMFYKLDGYTKLEKIQVKESINEVLRQNVNGLIRLYSFIYNRFPKKIIYMRFSVLNQSILETFDRKSPLYVAAYNSLIRMGKDVTRYPSPIIKDRFGNTASMPFVPFD